MNKLEIFHNAMNVDVKFLKNNVLFWMKKFIFAMWMTYQLVLRFASFLSDPFDRRDVLRQL